MGSETMSPFSFPALEICVSFLLVTLQLFFFPNARLAWWENKGDHHEFWPHHLPPGSLGSNLRRREAVGWQKHGIPRWQAQQEGRGCWLTWALVRLNVGIYVRRKKNEAHRWFTLLTAVQGVGSHPGLGCDAPSQGREENTGGTHTVMTALKKQWP